MATINTGRIYRFNLFGFRFMIWKKGKPIPNKGGGGTLPGSCKIVKQGKYIALAMPDGTILPHQLDVKIKAPLNACATAKVELFVTID